MIVLQVNNVTKSFAGEEILSGVKLEVQHRDRVALVGRNGAGKSTLLKIITGEMGRDEGDIIVPKDVRIGYLDQHTGLDTDRTIWEEMMTVFEPLFAMEKELRQLEQRMADPSVYGNEAEYKKVMDAYDSLQHRFAEAGGYQYESETRSVLHGMRFYPEDYGKPVRVLSGGQRTRLALARLLLSKPGLLILDEPTNHLDIETLSWLEKYLQGYEGAILIVSHDRYFLDQVVTIVYEVSRRKVTKYTGNYSAYLDQKAKNYERDRKMYEKQMDEKAKLEVFIQKNIARASTTKMAQSRRKVLEKTDWMEAPDGNEKSAAFTFGIGRKSGNDVMAVRDLGIGYGAAPVSSGLDFRVYREDRIAFIGPNGVGKSTLLKTLTGRLPKAEGSINLGTNVEFGFYDQEQAELTGNGTVLEEIWNEWPTMNEKDIRTLLGRFLFTGDDVTKPVNTLSGGEKARLALAKLVLEKSNTLVLDEPTNHLDLDSKEVLENALLDFPGTLLFVSHDRYFINRIATKVIELSPDGAEEFLGDYDYYVEKKREQEEIMAELAAEQQAGRPAAPKTANAPLDKETQREERRIRRALAEAEEEMAVLETDLRRLEEELNLPEHADDHVKLQEIQEQHDETSARHEACMERWMELQTELEKA
ncbi:ABC-F family ATP-binding cassette domain-containing protein [Bhargavaea ginsengi]|uniref:ABC-F family ATP-binding cassette domain-containing protein n=1 Tax=Bhargavaea ginsengi TaxID=426757 RepID=UPI00203CF4E5|nr:ABC-F family ATP-binding cassette domain-containing protein [Bhargavaea ginsengi]MCM3088439.1 ABC-F family ATP-binding cassette domain-containing protein [Bhargavaea ginsengi]